MANLPEIRHPLNRDGLSRNERLQPALDGDYFQLEERSPADFMALARELASQFQYYNASDQPSGDWAPFFDPDLPENNAQRLLFEAFLRAFGIIHDAVNSLTGRHLNFYYREVLRLLPQLAEPQQAHVLFELADHITQHVLPVGTLVAAGQNEAGEDIFFQTAYEVVLNRIRIASVRSVFVGKRIYAAIAANSADGMGTPFEEEAPKWAAFGEEQADRIDKGAGPNMVNAEVGFAIASPLLRLEEGVRTITLMIELDTAPSNLQGEHFQFFASGPEGFFEIKNTQTQQQVSFSIPPNSLEFTFTLQADSPAIIPFDSSLHPGGFESQHPLLKVVLMEGAYDILKDAHVENIKLKTGILGVKRLLLQNDQSKLDPNDNFLPFGSQPHLGSRFYLGHPYLLRYPIEDLKMNFEWHKHPGDLNTYFSWYNSGNNLPGSPFTVSIELLRATQWETVAGAEAIFTPLNSTSIDANYANSPHNVSSPQVINLPDTKSFTHQIQNDFLRLSLTGADSLITRTAETKLNTLISGQALTAFGHGVYPSMVSATAQHNANLIADTTPGLAVLVPPPPAPYTPELRGLSLDVNFKEQTFSTAGNEWGHFFHLSAFGQQKVKNTSEWLLPQYREEGYLYLGLENVGTPQQLNLLVQMAEGSADAASSMEDTGQYWEYLAGPVWKPIKSPRIVRDTTNRFQQSGIISLDIPSDISVDHSLMPAGQAWLRAVIPAQVAGINHLIELFPNAILATEQVPVGSDPLLKGPLPPERISGLVRRVPAIDSLYQPYTSFGGRRAEDEAAYWGRVAERLRHKNRSIQRNDYERMVLDAFPNIYKVKCISHTNAVTECAPGHVTVVVVPNLRNQHYRNPFQPTSSQGQLLAIQNHLKKHISPFVRLKVENALFEEVVVVFDVGFHPGYDEGLYGYQLLEEVKHHLSPWAFEEGVDIVFGETIYSSTILKFIEDRPYVDFVNNFRIYHSVYNFDLASSIFNNIESFDPGNSPTALYAITNKNGNDKVILADFKSNSDNIFSVYIIELQYLDPAGKEGTISIVKIDIDLILINSVSDGLSMEDYHARLLKKIFSKVTELQHINKLTRNHLRQIIENDPSVYKMNSIHFIYLPPISRIEDAGKIWTETDIIQANNSKTLLVSSNDHRITVYNSGDYKCQGNAILGIGYMITGSDFKIG